MFKKLIQLFAYLLLSASNPAAMRAVNQKSMGLPDGIIETFIDTVPHADKRQVIISPFNYQTQIFFNQYSVSFGYPGESSKTIKPEKHRDIVRNLTRVVEEATIQSPTTDCALTSIAHAQKGFIKVTLSEQNMMESTAAYSENNKLIVFANLKFRQNRVSAFIHEVRHNFWAVQNKRSNISGTEVCTTDAEELLFRDIIHTGETLTKRLLVLFDVYQALQYPETAKLSLDTPAHQQAVVSQISTEQKLTAKEKRQLTQLSQATKTYAAQEWIDFHPINSPLLIKAIKQGFLDHNGDLLNEYSIKTRGFMLRVIATERIGNSVTSYMKINVPPTSDNPLLQQALLDGLYMHDTVGRVYQSLSSKEQLAEKEAFIHQIYSATPGLMKLLYPGLNEYIASRADKGYVACMSKL